MAYTNLPALSANKVLTTCYLNDLNNNLRVLSLHNHSGSLGEGASLVRSASAASGLFYRYEIQTHFAPSQTNWDTNADSQSYLYGTAKQKSPTNQAASLKFPLGLYAGTYKLWVMFDDQNSGSSKIYLGGASIGSIIGRGSASLSAVCAFSGIIVENSASTVLDFVSDAAGGDFRITSFKIKRTGS